ncbi:Histone acetyltransferase rtt109 [Elsinoe australis]|uniref:Histone acetyltransferase rtt109 n=1 Tax=Elsinoe australis TaxID=40998 RepID=A0A2P7YDN3_9PEZI|nr:Histone acetyltransferase rtt109 [Elsinoe australis]
MTGGSSALTARSSVASLDQDSEVIVLRDIAEEPYEVREEKEPPSDEEADKPATPVAGQDTENLLVKGTTPKESELFAAIEHHRPKAQDINLKQWREKQRGLANAHNAPQLRQYLRKHQIQGKAPTVARKSKTPAMKTIDQSKLDNTHILVTPWFKTVTNSKTALPLEAEQLVSAKRVSNKQDLVDQIFRTVWKARPVEELDAKGELEIILQPNQWKLLQTRDATNLFRVLRRGVFYQRLKLDHDSLRGALRVYGPQEEAESFAQLVKEAFQSSVHRRISVAELAEILSCSADQALQKFTRTQLKRLEEMTRTVISANLLKQSIWISGFQETAVDEATRLIIAMLDLKLPVNHVITGTTGRCVIPTHAPPSLPIGVRYLSMFRMLFKRARHTPGSLGQDFNAPPNSDEEISIEHIQKPARGSLMWFENERARVLKHSPALDNKMWSVPGNSGPWRATFGEWLQENPTQPVGVAKASREKIDAPATHFHACVPSLSTTLSWFQRLSGAELQDGGIVGDYLVLKLIPNPYSEKHAVDNYHFPPLEIIFRTIENSDHETDLETNLTSEDSRFTFPITETKSLVLSSVNARVRQDANTVILPGKAVDVQFTRPVNAIADREKLMESQDFRVFINKVVQSYKSGAELQAPKHLRMHVPRCEPAPPAPLPVKKKERLKEQSRRAVEDAEKAKALVHEREVMYFFLGFEHREIRRIKPQRGHMPSHLVDESDVWTVTDVEGGIVGGRRNEFVLQQGVGNTDLDGFVQRTCSMVEFITKAHRGDIKPLLREKNVERAGHQQQQDQTKEGDAQDSDSKSPKIGSPKWKDLVLEKAEQAVEELNTDDMSAGDSVKLQPGLDEE